MRAGECSWEAAAGSLLASGGRRVGRHGGLVCVDGLRGENYELWKLLRVACESDLPPWLNEWLLELFVGMIE